MSTWTQVTVTHLHGGEIDVAVVQRLIEKHTGMDWFEGSHPDYPVTGHYEGTAFVVDTMDKTTVVGEQNSKYMVTGDWAKVSRKLTKKLGVVSLVVTEEWDDEGPGREVTTWVAGTQIAAESSQMRDVNDVLAGLIDVSKPPTLLTWDDIDAMRESDIRDRFIMIRLRDGEAAA